VKGPSIEVFYGKQKRDKTRELWRQIDDQSAQTHLLLQGFHSCCSKQGAASSRALSHEAHCHHPLSSTQSKGLYLPNSKAQVTLSPSLAYKLYVKPLKLQHSNDINHKKKQKNSPN
jgi:hypothetical protein